MFVLSIVYYQVYEPRQQSQLLSHDLQARKCKRSRRLSKIMNIAILIRVLIAIPITFSRMLLYS